MAKTQELARMQMRQHMIPVVPLRGIVVFPNTVNHFDIGRSKSIAAVDAAFEDGSRVFLVTQKDFTVDDPKEDDLYRYGVVAEVKQVLRFSDTIIKVLVDCKYRARLDILVDDGNCFMAHVTKAGLRRIKPAESDTADALVRTLRALLETYLQNNQNISADVIIEALAARDPNALVETLAFHLPIDYEKKQQVLECSSVMDRLQLMVGIMSKENSVVAIEKEISDKVNEQMDRNQKEYYLREQMKAISEELGEGGDDTSEDVKKYKKRIAKLPLDKKDKEKLNKEADRLGLMQRGTQEAGVIMTYLDTVLDLPWGVYTKDNLDLVNARKILERDHYDLEKVKDRIIEFLAVKNLTDSFGTQIICMVGPPGTGKTSIAKSIAEAMGRNFVRLSLGGVRDEAEIRGHRRTYVAAMPGRIIDAVQQAGSQNPVILLDEIDKLGHDWNGDPSSALLEVLDPEQNWSFKDHYLDVPFDLSKVLFLTTANDESAIPAPLHDRMEIIELSSYTRQEKFQIAKQHLVAKEIKRNGLKPEQFSITDEALYSLIDDYTREAGVRELERKIAKLIRYCAVKIVGGKYSRKTIEASDLEGILGPKLDRGSIASHHPQVGVVNGLAWTSVGGEMLPIEAVIVDGSGKIELTGSLGDVMKESAKIALTLTRILGARYGVPADFAKDKDVHIHAPEGAVPKDGPSAGVTLVTALVSAASGLKVRSDIAMTGEITLTGEVLPIGGLKEKLIAAYREKMKVVLIPKTNIPDLYDVSSEVKKGLRIVPVETVDEVLEAALIKRRGKQAAKKTARKTPEKTTAAPKARPVILPEEQPQVPGLPI